MKFKNLPTLSKFCTEASGLRLPCRIAYKIVKLTNLISEPLKFYQTRLQEIISTYCVIDEDGNIQQKDNGFVIQPDKIEQCDSEMNELDNLDFDVSSIQFTLEELDNFTIDPLTLSVVLELVKD